MTPGHYQRPLSAPEYVLALHPPEDRVAVLVRNRARRQTMQRILAAEDVASRALSGLAQGTKQVWCRHFHRHESPPEQQLRENQGKHPRNSPCVSRSRRRRSRIASCDPHDRRRSPSEFRARYFAREKSSRMARGWSRPGASRILVRALATQFRGDPAATDISRVLRVPGFTNWKYNERFLVRALQETDQIYQLRDFVVHEDSPEPWRAPKRFQEPARRMPPDTGVSPKPIGHTPNVHWREAMIPKKSCAVSPTIGLRTKPIHNITRTTLWQKCRPTGKRTGRTPRPRRFRNHRGATKSSSTSHSVFQGGTMPPNSAISTRLAKPPDRPKSARFRSAVRPKRFACSRCLLRLAFGTSGIPRRHAASHRRQFVSHVSDQRAARKRNPGVQNAMAHACRGCKLSRSCREHALPLRGAGTH